MRRAGARIRTSIAGMARFAASAGDAEREALAKVDDRMLRTPPETCAKQILDGVARGKRKVLTGYKARTIDIVSRLIPARYPRLLAAYGL